MEELLEALTRFLDRVRWVHMGPFKGPQTASEWQISPKCRNLQNNVCDIVRPAAHVFQQSPIETPSAAACPCVSADLTHKNTAGMSFFEYFISSPCENLNFLLLNRLNHYSYNFESLYTMILTHKIRNIL